jgi:hypothetical protein
MQPIRSHDGLFRFVFGEPEQMAELLRACVPAAVARGIDWPTLRRLPESFVDKALQGRRTDMVFSVRLGNATALLYVVPEHKSKDERFTAWQVTCYVVRILERWRAEHPDADRLPAVLPFVLYHGDAPWRAPRSPHELVDFEGCGPDIVESLAPLQLRLPFLLLDLSQLDEAQLESMRLSAVSELTLRFLQFLRSAPPAESGALIRRWQHLIQQLLGHPRGEDVLFALLSWYIASHRADRETLRTVMTKIREENPPMRSCLDLLLEMNEARGAKRAERRGLEKGVGVARSILEGQLRARFGEVPQPLRRRIAAGSAVALRRWSLRLVTASCIDDVFAKG